MGRLASLWPDPLAFNPSRHMNGPKPSSFVFTSFQVSGSCLLGQDVLRLQISLLFFVVYGSMRVPVSGAQCSGGPTHLPGTEPGLHAAAGKEGAWTGRRTLDATSSTTRQPCLTRSPLLSVQYVLSVLMLHFRLSLEDAKQPVVPIQTSATMPQAQGARVRLEPRDKSRVWERQ